MSPKRPPVEIVSDRITGVLDDLRAFVGMAEKVQSTVSGLLEDLSRPGGVRAEIEMDERGPKVRIKTREKQDGDRPRLRDSAEQPEGKRADRKASGRKPPARRAK